MLQIKLVIQHSQQWQTVLVQFLSEEDGISKKVSVLIALPGSIGMEFILLFRGGPDAKFTATGTEFQNRE